MDHVRQRGQPVDDLADLGALVEQLAAVAVAIHAEDQLGRKLRVAVEHAARAEIRPQLDHTAPMLAVAYMATMLRACSVDRRPRGRRARCRGRASGWRARAHDAPTRRPGHGRQRPALGQVNDGVLAGTLVAQRVRGVVEPRAREPLGARHGALAEHLRRAAWRTPCRRTPPSTTRRPGRSATDQRHEAS